MSAEFLELMQRYSHFILYIYILYIKRIAYILYNMNIISYEHFYCTIII